MFNNDPLMNFNLEQERSKLLLHLYSLGHRSKLPMEVKKSRDVLLTFSKVKNFLGRLNFKRTTYLVLMDPNHIYKF